MGKETIDLYCLHRTDPQVAIEESVGALAEMQQQGKIKHIGISNDQPKQVTEAVAAINVFFKNQIN